MPVSVAPFTTMRGRSAGGSGLSAAGLRSNSDAHGLTRFRGQRLHTSHLLGSEGIEQLVSVETIECVEHISS